LVISIFQGNNQILLDRNFRCSLPWQENNFLNQTLHMLHRRNSFVSYHLWFLLSFVLGDSCNTAMMTTRSGWPETKLIYAHCSATISVFSEWNLYSNISIMLSKVLDYP
jgi:hypothetical protein